jgi:hypothetical protein
VRQDEAGIDGEQRRVHYLSNAGYINARVVGIGMVAVDEQDKGRKQSESSDITDRQDKPRVNGTLRKSKRAGICFQKR